MFCTLDGEGQDMKGRVRWLLAKSRRLKMSLWRYSRRRQGWIGASI